MQAITIQPYDINGPLLQDSVMPYSSSSGPTESIDYATGPGIINEPVYYTEPSITTPPVSDPIPAPITTVPQNFGTPTIINNPIPTPTTIINPVPTNNYMPAEPPIYIKETPPVIETTAPPILPSTGYDFGNIFDWIKANPVPSALIGYGLYWLFFAKKKK